MRLSETAPEGRVSDATRDGFADRLALHDALAAAVAVYAARSGAPLFIAAGVGSVMLYELAHTYCAACSAERGGVPAPPATGSDSP